MTHWTRRLFTAGLLAVPLMVSAQTAAATAAAPAPATTPASTSTSAATPTAGALPDSARIGAYVQKIFDEQKLTADGPGVVVLVARGDQLLYQGGRGMASIELGVPIATDMRFRIGSVTKQFASATLLKLIDQGRAKLDDPLSKYLPDYPKGEGITLRQLLNHTSGVKSYTGIRGYMHNPIRRDLDTKALIAEFKDLPVDFPPGERFAYNNSGYVLVGAVIEAITGKTWHQAVQELVLAPAGLQQVVYPGEQRLVPRMVEGYSVDRETGAVTTAGLLSMTQPQAAGALVSDAQDLWRWNRALHGGKLLSPALYQQMITPEGAAKEAGYGYGITVGTLRGEPKLEHGGGIHGFVSGLTYLPQSGVSVVLLRNTDGPGFSLGMAGRKLAAFVIGKPYPDIVPVTLSTEQLQAFAGGYKQQADATAQRELQLHDGKLRWLRQGRPILTLVPTGKDSLAMEGTIGVIKVERNADGSVAALVFFGQGGEPGEAGERWLK
ncbi:serine hydrolase domain-containing protein [Roseateles sp.]|uniref:serine hydrolase domain-containing protein n=1 Tax=Roseateles sp. TaxID=1971397 RepID=UPI0031D61F10